MEKKVHYKMYKAGKNWAFVILSTVALTGVMAMNGNTAKADAVVQSTTEQVAKVDTTSTITTSIQATTQVEKATNNVNESNAAQTSATTTTEQSSSNADATSSSQNNKQATTTSVVTFQNTLVSNKDQA
ncbi:KxYKxGKxW signal peptide domain-containing protein, partial [Lactobacillus salivarius]